MPSQPFPATLPLTCHFPNSTSSNDIYNKGVCPQTPCHTLFGDCLKRHGCCLSDWETRAVPLECGEGTTETSVTVIVSCRCQPCNKIHMVVSGLVLSSLQRKPIPLVAVVFNNEVFTFTDKEGHFVFEVSVSDTSTRETILFREPNHRPLEVTFSLTATSDMIVLMEHISTVTEIRSFNNSNVLLIASSNPSSIVGFLHLPTCGLLTGPSSTAPYLGSGRVLHSLSSGTPRFTTLALQKPIYKDTRGVEFIIFSLASGTLSILDENGVPLHLRGGTSMQLDLVVMSETKLDDKEMSKVHLFEYREAEQRWTDRGQMRIQQVSREGDWYHTRSSIKTGHLPSLWTMAIPIRATCYIRLSINQPPREGWGLSNIQIHMEQTNGATEQPKLSYYQQLMCSASRVHCLRAVCTFGGVLSVSDQHGHPYKPVSPSIKYGLQYGDKGQLMFYCNDKEEINATPTSPYYPSLQQCMNSSDTISSQFVFDPPSSLLHTKPHPLPFQYQPPGRPMSYSTEYSRQCYLKVGVLVCALETDILVHASSPGTLNGGFVISETVYHPSGQNECSEDSVLHPLAACLQYPCGHSLLVSAKYYHHGNISVSCIPWTFSPSLVSVTRTQQHSIIIQVNGNQ